MQKVICKNLQNYLHFFQRGTQTWHCSAPPFIITVHFRETDAMLPTRKSELLTALECRARFLCSRGSVTKLYWSQQALSYAHCIQRLDLEQYEFDIPD